MADGVRIGGAYFEFEAQNTQLLGAFVQSKAKAAEAAAAIKKAVDLQSAAIKSGSTVAVQAAATQTRAAQGAIQAAQQASQRYQALRAAAQSAAAGVTQASNQINSANRSVLSSFNLSGRSALSFAGTLVGVQAGAAGLHQVLESLAAATFKAADAQFALNKTYGQGAGQFNRLAQELAQTQAVTVAEVQRGAAIFGTLQNNYGFTTEQIEKLIKVSLDMAAVTGVDAVEAFKSVQAAMRGEGEAAEKLGFTLNRDAVKAMGAMTAEQRKNFETLSDVERAQLIYTEALRQAAPFQDAATEKAKTGAGEFYVLQKNIENLSQEMGKGLLPALAEVAKILNEGTNNVRDLSQAFKDFPQTPDAIKDFLKLWAAVGLLGPLAGPSVNRIIGDVGRRQRIFQGISPETQAGLEAAYPPDYVEPGPVDVNEVRRRRAQQIAAQAEARRRAKETLDAEDDAVQERTRRAIAAIDAERKAKEKWYDEEKQRIEARREYQLEDIERRKDAALQAIEAEKEARKDALQAAIDAAEREKEVRLLAIEEAKDQSVRAIEEQERRNTETRKQEDRDLDDARRSVDRDISDRREAEDQSRETLHRREMQRIEREHEARVQALDDEVKKVERNADRRSKAIDEEIQRLRDSDKDRQRRQDDLQDSQEEAHRQLLSGLDEELEARTKILDAQLEALDAQEKAEKASRRIVDLQRQIGAARENLEKLEGNGDPEAIAVAQQALLEAVRAGNSLAAQAARQALDKAAGTGNPEEIKKARKELAEAERNLQEQLVDDAREAEKAKLQAAKKTIQDDIEARRKAADEEHRIRQKSLEEDQDAEDRKLEKAIRNLEKRKARVQETAKSEIESIRDRRDRENAAFEQANEEIRIRYDQETARIAQTREVEDRALEDSRRAEDRKLEDSRRVQDLALQAQRKAIDDNLEAERRALEEHYNGPRGVITQLRAASEQVEREFSRRLAAARAAFEEERKAAERVYRNPEGNGLLDNLEKAREAELASLDQSKKDWQEWERSIRENIQDAKKDLDAFIESVKRSGDAASAIGSSTFPGSPAARARNKTSGDATDVENWLQQAIQITGVDKDWIKDLTWLVAHESSGNPEAKNPNSTASGLFQLIDTTWAAYRDRKQPNDVLDPVANAVAAIRYIKDVYKHPSKAVEHWKKKEWYDGGGLISQPTALVDIRSGSAYGIMAEKGPEFILGSAASRRILSSPSLISPGRGLDYGSIGSDLLNGYDTDRTWGDSWVFQGIGMNEVGREVQRQQHKAQLLRGMRRARI